MFPRSVWIADFMSKYKFSFHLMSGDIGIIYLLLGIHFLAALAYMLGYRTKIAGWVLFVFTCSLQSRNNLILSSADDLIRLALLWSLFLPIQSYFSIDILNSRKSNTPDNELPTNTISSAFTFAFTFQLLIMYITTAIFKKHPVWLSEGSAVYYALNLDLYTKPIAHLFKDQLQLTQLVTWATLLLEFLGPIAYFFGARIRSLVVASFILFHLSLFAFIEIGLFPWVAAVFWLAMTPSFLWDSRVGQKLELRLTDLFHQLQIKTNAKSIEETLEVSRPLKLYFALILTLMVWTNLSHWLKTPEKLEFYLDQATDRLYVNQRWDMFAPYPIRNDGWFVIPGQFEDGTEIDLWTQKTVTFEKPALVSASFPNSEWRKIMVNLWDRGQDRLTLPIARLFCRMNEESKNERSSVRTFQIYFMKERTPKMGESFPPVEKISLWSHQCF